MPKNVISPSHSARGGLSDNASYIIVRPPTHRNGGCTNKKMYVKYPSTH